MANTYGMNYSGGKEQRDHGSEQPRQSHETLSQKYPAEKGLVLGAGGSRL
jgi:hypothetical protein